MKILIYLKRNNSKYIKKLLSKIDEPQYIFYTFTLIKYDKQWKHSTHEFNQGSIIYVCCVSKN